MIFLRHQLHANNMLLQQQYRERGFTKYSELISVILLVKQNNELLMKNHQARPTSSTPFPKANFVTSSDYGRGRAREHGFGHGRGQNYHNFSKYKKKAHPEKWKKNEENPKGIMMGQTAKSIFHYCGMKGHWSRTCRTSKQLVNLYQTSLKNVEINFTEQNDPLGISHLEAHIGNDDQVNLSTFTHIEVGDFFEDVDVNMPKFGIDEPKNK
ncbi:uncharacterized protein LOC141714764 [Apium graveolens]|uniref:uncharacterized protein LOC141714764 n=1 Tax=Apium graveolens TaxID=4045 RepID=UPI003D7B56C9